MGKYIKIMVSAVCIYQSLGKVKKYGFNNVSEKYVQPTCPLFLNTELSSLLHL